MNSTLLPRCCLLPIATIAFRIYAHAWRASESQFRFFASRREQTSLESINSPRCAAAYPSSILALISLPCSASHAPCSCNRETACSTNLSTLLYGPRSTSCLINASSSGLNSIFMPTVYLNFLFAVPLAILCFLLFGGFASTPSRISRNQRWMAFRPVPIPGLPIPAYFSNGLFISFSIPRLYAVCSYLPKKTRVSLPGPLNQHST
jgi:hypothetical protein